MESKKTEKLASALYLLTSFFDDKEPMKWRLRELAGGLVAHKEPRNIVLELIGLLTVAKNAGLVSDTNYEIMHRELSGISPQVETLGEMFKKLEVREEHKAPVHRENIQDKPQDRPERPSFYISSSVHSAPVIKDRLPKEPAREPKDGVVAQKKNSRQGTILGLLKKKKEIMVKDVVPLIEGVSEKTIQRELLALVSKGILRKEGEKRWSRYSLAEE